MWPASISMGYVGYVGNAKQALSIGINYMDSQPPIHAEEDAIMKLRFNKKRKIKIDMVVIRYNKSNNLCESKPCINCISAMYISCIKKGYIIKDVYHSTHDGVMIKRKLTDLINDKIQHISMFNRNTNNARMVDKLKMIWGINFEYG